MKIKIIIKLLFTAIIVFMLSSCSTNNDKIGPEPIPDWTLYKIENVSFQLPEIYSEITDQAKQYSSIESKDFLFMAVKPSAMGNMNESTILITKEKLSETTTLDQYMETLMDPLPVNCELISSEELSSNGYPTGKFVISITNPESDSITQEIYFIMDDRTIYQINFSNRTDTYNKNQNEFMQIIDRLSFARDNSDIIARYYRIGMLILIINLFILRAWLKRRKRSNDTTSLTTPTDV